MLAILMKYLRVIGTKVFQEEEEMKWYLLKLELNEPLSAYGKKRTI